MALEAGLRQVDRADQVAAVRVVAVDGPLGDARHDHLVGEAHLPGHLAEIAVAEDHHRVPVLERQLERQHGAVEHLLRRGGDEDDPVRVAVTEAAAGQLDVRLLGPDVPRPGPPRMMFTKTAGTSAPIRYEIPSSMRLKPGELVKVMHRFPAPPRRTSC